LAVGSAVLVALLVILAATVGLGPLGWAVGLGCGVITVAAVARGTHTLGPADLVTLGRAEATCALAALVADSFVHDAEVLTLVALATVATGADAVDGWVARHTRTTSSFGARFDGEVDAFLFLVLSVYVANSGPVWVLAIGLARYAFAVAGWVLPWMRAQLPPRWWRKVAAAVQGAVLTVAIADVTPSWLTTAALVVALALLTESFGRDVVWLWRNRSGSRQGLTRHAGRSRVAGA
jgi:phosphatidylglycerophosphate synthase